MAQKFANAARSALTAGIGPTDTSFSIGSSAADLFPVANTGTSAVGTVGKDWFKVVLEDADHNIEIVYVRTRQLGSPGLSNVLRGQEGTTARLFLAGSIVGLRHTAMDLGDAISFASGASAFWRALVGYTTAAASRLQLGASAVGDAVFTAASAADARNAIGASDGSYASAAGACSGNAATATLAANVQGFTTVGNNVGRAADAAAARTALDVYSKAESSALGIGLGYSQTWQNVTGSREAGTTYYNTTGKPISVSALINLPSNQSQNLQVNGVIADSAYTGVGIVIGVMLKAVVPPGASYILSGGLNDYWEELR